MQIWRSQVLEKAGVSKKMKLGNNLYMHNNVAASATCMKRKRQERKAAISNEELIRLVRPFLSETRLFSTHHLLKDCAQELEAWMGHFKMRDHMRMRLQMDRLQPDQGTLYIWSDWKEPGTTVTLHPFAPVESHLRH